MEIRSISEHHMPSFCLFFGEQVPSFETADYLYCMGEESEDAKRRGEEEKGNEEENEVKG